MLPLPYTRYNYLQRFFNLNKSSNLVPTSTVFSSTHSLLVPFSNTYISNFLFNSCSRYSSSKASALPSSKPSPFKTALRSINSPKQPNASSSTRISVKLETIPSASSSSPSLSSANKPLSQTKTLKRKPSSSNKSIPSFTKSSKARSSFSSSPSSPSSPSSSSSSSSSSFSQKLKLYKKETTHQSNENMKEKKIEKPIKKVEVNSYFKRRLKFHPAMPHIPLPPSQCNPFASSSSSSSSTPNSSSSSSSSSDSPSSNPSSTPTSPPVLSKRKQFLSIQYRPEILSMIQKEYLSQSSLSLLKTKQKKTEIVSKNFHFVFKRGAKNVDSFYHLLPDHFEIAFLGRSNVGKSNLINQLFATTIARVKDKPGCTQSINWYQVSDTSKLWVVDMPGYGFAYAKEDDQTAWGELTYEFLKRPTLSRLYLLLDARHGFKYIDIQFLESLKDRGISNLSISLILTKCDLVPELTLARRHLLVCQEASRFGIQNSDVFMVSGKTGAGIPKLRNLIHMQMFSSSTVFS